MIPAWLPESLWDEFRKMRKLTKHPMTEHAEMLILARLERFKAEGLDPIASINESIEFSYRGVFPPKNGHAAPGFACPPKGVNTASVCCMCKGSLEAGFMYCSGGRKCHQC